MIEYLQQLDQELFLYLNNLGTANWDWFWTTITNEYLSLPIYVLITWLIYKKTGFRKAFVSVALIGAMVISTYGFAEIIKHLTARVRPCAMGFDARILVQECDDYGFFSAHSSCAMAIAVLTGLILKPYYKIAFYGMLAWAILMAYSRIYVGKHFPGDVIVGLLVGVIAGLLFYRLQGYIIKKWAL